MGISPKEIILRVKSHLESVFTETIAKYVFLRTPVAQLSTIISNRDVRAKDEYVIVECIVMWVQYDIEDRLQHANSLLELVDCGLCSQSMMLDNKSINTNIPLLDKLLQQLHIKITILNNNCTKDLIKQYGIEKINSIEVHREVLVKLKSSSKYLCHVSEDGIYNTISKERLVQYNFGAVDKVIYTTKEVLFIFSFGAGKMYKYNISTEEIDECSYPTNSCFHYSSSVNEISYDQLVVIGGLRSIGVYTNEVRYYDIANDSWSKSLNLPYDICNHATVEDGNELYVIGGYNVTDLRRYRNGTWQTLSPLLNSRQCHIAVLDGNCIYVYGGNGINSECYNISTDQWSIIDSDVYKSSKSYNSVIDIDNGVLYTHEDDNVYSISLDNNSKSLFCKNVSCRRLVLMHI